MDAIRRAVLATMCLVGGVWAQEPQSTQHPPSPSGPSQAEPQAVQHPDKGGTKSGASKQKKKAPQVHPEQLKGSGDPGK